MTDWKHNCTILELMNKIIVILINKEEVDFLHISIRNPNFFMQQRGTMEAKAVYLAWRLKFILS